MSQLLQNIDLPNKPHLTTACHCNCTQFLRPVGMRNAIFLCHSRDQYVMKLSNGAREHMQFYSRPMCNALYDLIGLQLMINFDNQLICLIFSPD